MLLNFDIYKKAIPTFSNILIPLSNLVLAVWAFKFALALAFTHEKFSLLDVAIWLAHHSFSIDFSILEVALFEWIIAIVGASNMTVLLIMSRRGELAFPGRVSHSESMFPRTQNRHCLRLSGPGHDAFWSWSLYRHFISVLDWVLILITALPLYFRSCQSLLAFTPNINSYSEAV